TPYSVLRSEYGVPAVGYRTAVEAADCPACQAPGMSTVGGGPLRLARRPQTSSVNSTHTPARVHWTTFIPNGGTNRCHRLTPSSSTHVSGTRYLMQVIITWSMRSRGSVQRTHIITNTNSQPLMMKTSTLITWPKTPSSRLSSQGTTPRCQPPRKSSVAMPLTANMLPYSAMK